MLGAVVNPDAPVFSQLHPIHQAQCSLLGQAAMITEIPPEKFNMGNSRMSSHQTLRYVVNYFQVSNHWLPMKLESTSTPHKTRWDAFILEQRPWTVRTTRHTWNERPILIRTTSRSTKFPFPMIVREVSVHSIARIVSCRINRVLFDRLNTFFLCVLQHAVHAGRTLQLCWSRLCLYRWGASADRNTWECLQPVVWRTTVSTRRSETNQVTKDDASWKNHFRRWTTFSREHRKFDNQTDIGIKPGNGLHSPRIALADVEKNVSKPISTEHSLATEHGWFQRVRLSLSEEEDDPAVSTAFEGCRDELLF